jgi:transcriptional regulator with XRE-family HTH domain
LRICQETDKIFSHFQELYGRKRSQRHFSQELKKTAEPSIAYPRGLGGECRYLVVFLSDVERANRWPYLDTLVRLAQALNVEVYELLKPEEALPPDHLPYSPSIPKKPPLS